ncbi:MAG: DUF3307 domain-containing protein [Planctomycetota bacterium]|nr:DUF3307 domain-containing protein [Planctomycetota bacterium]
MNLLLDPQIQIIFLAVVTSHLIGDFVLQSDDLVRAKRGNLRIALRYHALHGLIHGLVAWVLLGFWLNDWPLPVIVAFSHAAIDIAKEAVLKCLPTRDENDRILVRWKLTVGLAGDQVLHLGVLLVAVYVLAAASLLPAESCWSGLLGQHYRPIFVPTLVFISASVFTIFVGGVVIAIVTEPIVQEIRQCQTAENELPSKRRGLAKGGRYIGQLERTLILLFILSGQPAGVGFLVTAKSVFRFGDLKDHEDRMEAEYIIIGTMLSFAWGLAFAWLTQYALQKI